MKIAVVSITKHGIALAAKSLPRCPVPNCSARINSAPKAKPPHPA